MPSRSTVALLLLLAGLLGGFFALMRYDQGRIVHEEPAGPEAAPAAPPDLEKHREEFLAGVAALQRQDSLDAIRHFTSFSLSPREVEQYRLYFLANAYQLGGHLSRARTTLATLWEQEPRLVYLSDTALNLHAHYAANGSWEQASRIPARLVTRDVAPPVLATARSAFALDTFYLGDPGAMIYATRNTLIESPKAEQAPDAERLLRGMLGLADSAPVPMSLPERIRRAENLVRDGDAAAALRELSTLNPDTLATPYRQQVILTRGVAHHRLRQFKDSDQVLQPLFSGYYKFAEPALLYSAKNNRIIGASINPTVIKTVTERKRTGTRRVKVKGKTVRRPVYRNVKKDVKLVDLNKKKQKEEHERRYSERLKDILQIPASTAARKEALSALVALAQEKKQTEYLMELAPELSKLDPLSEPALQYFWDNGWEAYQRGDMDTARERFAFIVTTYPNPNVKRQASYWLARVLERSGERERAEAMLRDLADAPYDDLYALHVRRRGIKPRDKEKPAPFEATKKDWEEIADEALPRELRLAYELTALGVYKEARLEVQTNANDANRKYADAILGDLYHSEGATILSHRFIRRAFPQLATVEQDEVPQHFLRIYYPLRYEAEIREAAKDRNLDPYLVMALVHQESAFNPDIRSRVGAIGLMQLMPSTGRELGNRFYAAFTESRLQDPKVNLDLGTRYLRWLLDRVGGTVELALASYNAGPGNVSRWRRAAPRKPLDEFIESIPYSETRGYVKRITLLRSSYEKLHDQLHPTASPAGL